MILVTGGSGSGKSEYAEQLILGFGKARRFYVATMEVFGEEGRRKVERHRSLRKTKGFITIEQPKEIGAICLVKFGKNPQNQPPQSDCCEEKTAVLLECIMNLAANEMFSDPFWTSWDNAREAEDFEEGRNRIHLLAKRIEQEVCSLEKQADFLVVVTGEVGEDGCEYSEETMAYIRLMEEVNRRLAARSEQVWLVTCGIGVNLKGEETKPWI